MRAFQGLKIGLRVVAARSSMRRAVPCFAGRTFATKVDMKMLKTLREMTGAPIVDCKKAVIETAEQTEEDPITAACNWLRLAGKSQMAKKADRKASEGLIALQTTEDSSKGVLVEINSETDFVAKNEKFQALLFDVVGVAGTMEAPTLEAVQNAPSNVASGTVADHLADTVTALREKITITRIQGLQADAGGVVASYMHQKEMLGNLPASTLVGRIGCLAKLQPAKGTQTSQEDLKSFGQKLTIHIAASSPKYLDRTMVDADAAEAEKKLLLEQAESSGKPAKFLEKMVMGRMNKFYEQSCLVDQKFISEDDSTPKVSKAATDAGAEISSFLRFQLGELSAHEPDNE